MKYKVEDETLLMIPSENVQQEKTEHSHCYDDNFMVMLEKYCKNYHIITSINGLIYRVEVYQNDDLEDAIEISCDELKTYPESDILFMTQYKQAHKNFVNRFCNQSVPTCIEEESVNEEEVISDLCEDDSMIETMSWQELFLRNIKAYIQKARQYRNKLFFAGGILFLLIFVLLGRSFLCNETLVHFFFTSFSFYEKTEFFCHKLEKKCIILSKTNLDQDTEILPKDCRNWCDKKIINADSCALFLPYFPKKNERTVYKELKKINIEEPKTKKAKSPYSIFPKGTIVLQLHKNIKLNVSNRGIDSFKVELESLHIKESENEEIIQFKSGVTELYLEEGETKYFEIFIEPTYYEQFKKGEYHGTILLKMLWGDKHKVEVAKDFVFRVQ